MSSNSDVRWRFRAMAPGEMNHDPMEREFFDNETINTRLARESIQNSLDAAADRSRPNPIRMRFSLAGVHSPLSAEQAAPYLTGLIDHLNCVDHTHLSDDIATRIDNGDLTRGGMPFLVIEDAGTQGLTGDWLQFDDSEYETGQDNHFYWFFRKHRPLRKRRLGQRVLGSWQVGVSRRFPGQRLHRGHQAQVG